MNYLNDLNTFAPEDVPEFLSFEEESERTLFDSIEELVAAMEDESE